MSNFSMNLDLDIENYSLEDILNLFNIELPLTKDKMDIAKRITLRMHPDKSNLSKEYFLFFSKAFKLLNDIYVFNNSKNKSTVYDNSINEENKALIDNLKFENHREFNMWFNSQFDKLQVFDEYKEGGYGDWMKSDDNLSTTTCKSQADMHNQINQKKAKAEQLIKASDIKEFNQSNYCDFFNSKIDNYSSDMFSSLKFQDLKEAHTDTVIPVTEASSRSPQTFEGMRSEREQQISPMSEAESNRILNSKLNDEKVSNSYKAYNMAKQQELIEKQNNTFWSNLKKLK